MKLLSKLKHLVRRGALVGAVSAAAVGAGLFVTNSVSAASTCPSGFNGDNNAVIWCGAHTTGSSSAASAITSRYNNGDGHNSAASIHNIYGSSSFNISSSDIQNLSKDAQLGSVIKSSGDVTVNGKVVATNAISAGRQDIAGSTRHVNNGTVFYTRDPEHSFLNSSLSAYVVMQNGQFKFAILVACGNPVTAKPKPAPSKPNFNINKEVAVKGSSNYAKSIKVKTGTHVVYRITVNSTGNTPVTNLKVSDKLPSDAQYVSGTLQRDGKAADSSAFFGSGIAVSSLKNGTSTVFTFEAVIGPKDTVESCQPETLDNVGNMSATSLPSQSSTATVSKTCLPKPVYACTSLSSFADSRTDFTFTAKANASNGATITAYNFDFGDGTTKTVTTASENTTAEHTYANAGTFNAAVSVVVSVGGTSKTVTAAACATKVTVTPPPASAECTDLQLDQDAGNPRAVTATAVFTTKNGATLTNATFDWGDGSTPTSGTGATASHTFQQDGSFTVKATLSFSSQSGKVPNSNCQAPITVTTVMPTCDSFTLDVNNDDKTVTITGLTFTANNGTYQTAAVDWGDGSPALSASDVTGQTHTYTTDGPFTVVATPHFLVNGVDTPITSQACQQTVSFTETPTPPTTPPQTPPVTPPTTLVNTGAGSVVGLFAAAVFVGVFGYRRFLNRRLSREQL